VVDNQLSEPSASNQTATCPSGTALCANECRALQVDPTNCGGCGAACAASGACRSGVCVSPSPDPTPPPPPPPTVAANAVSLAVNAPSLVISGTNFDPTAAGNVVTLRSGAVGGISSASATSLTVLFSPPPSLGSLTAVVTTSGGSSGSPVQVASVVAAPAVTSSTSSLAQNAPSIVIAGSGFDPTAAGNSVAFSPGGAQGTVSAATSTSLTVTFTAPPSGLGSLSAVVTSFQGSSGAAAQVASIVAAPSVALVSTNIGTNAATLDVTGSGFDPMAAGNSVVLSSGTVRSISAPSATLLTVVFSSPPSPGVLAATVTSFDGSSGAAVQGELFCLELFFSLFRE